MMPFIVSRLSPGLGDDAQTFAGVDLLAQRPPPPFVVEIPADRLLDAALESLERAPAEFALELGRVDGVAPVVSRPVGDEGDKGFVRAGHRAKPVEDGADPHHDIDIAAFVAAADVVFFANPAARRDE